MEKQLQVWALEVIKRNNSVKSFEFGSVVQEMYFKRFLIWSSGDSPVQWSGTVYANLKEGIMGNIHVKLYEIRTSGSGEVVLRKKFTDGRTTGGLITIAHLEPLAQVS